MVHFHNNHTKKVCFIVKVELPSVSILLELLLLELLLLGLLLLETDHEERELPRRSVRLGARTAQSSTHVAYSLPYSAVFSKKKVTTDRTLRILEFL